MKQSKGLSGDPKPEHKQTTNMFKSLKYFSIGR